MTDYEEAILASQESMSDDCAGCGHIAECKAGKIRGERPCEKIIVGRPLWEIYPKLIISPFAG